MMPPKYRSLPSNASSRVSVVPSGFGSGAVVLGAGPVGVNMSWVPAKGESSMSSGDDQASTCLGKMVGGDSTLTGAMPDGAKYGR